MKKRLILPILIALLAALTLTGCGSSTTDKNTSAKPDSSHASDGEDVMIMDAWVADKSPSDPTMTAAFGTLMNHSDKDVTVTGGSTDIAAKVELHEVVSDGAGGMKMQPKEGGFEIKGGAEHELAPGHDHIMLMGLKRALKPGEKVTVKLTLSNGGTMEFTAPVKPFTGADEKYKSSN